MRDLLGVAGWPVGHSRSPAMQNAALTALGLDWLYVPLPLPPERFHEAVPALPASGFRGINVTVPHKQAAFALATDRSDAAEAIGAANTLTFHSGGAIHAENTDAGGFIDALGESVRGRRALVLGAGGSARAVVWALGDAGAAEVAVYNRTTERARDLAATLGAKHVVRPEAADLMVNCTTVGLDPAISPQDAAEAVGVDGLEPPETFADLVYGDGPTALERWAGEGGSRTVGGLEVLVHQGARSLEGWTGKPAPLEVMRAAAERGL